MKFENPYMSMFLKIQDLQIWVLVHAYLYYECDVNIVEDKVYDDNARQLEAMMKLNPDDAERTSYWYVFSDFTSATGFDLWHKLCKADKEYIREKAKQAIWATRHITRKQRKK